MKQFFKNPVDQVAMGDINNHLQCPLQEVTTITDADDHAGFMQEMQEYNEFYRLTGMRAARVERIALTRLIKNHPFTHKQAKVAWNASTLFYEDGYLQTKASNLEYFMGWVVLVLCIDSVFLLLIGLLVSEPNVQFFKLIIQLILFIFALGAATRYSIAPTYLAKRIGRCL